MFQHNLADATATLRRQARHLQEMLKQSQGGGGGRGSAGGGGGLMRMSPLMGASGGTLAQGQHMVRAVPRAKPCLMCLLGWCVVQQVACFHSQWDQPNLHTHVSPMCRSQRCARRRRSLTSQAPAQATCCQVGLGWGHEG